MHSHRKAVVPTLALFVLCSCAEGIGANQGSSGSSGSTAISGSEEGGAASTGGGGSVSGAAADAVAGQSGSVSGSPSGSGAPASAGASGSASSGVPVVMAPAARGATLPYLEYQAEDGHTNGTLIGPSRQLGDLASEASQRKAVRLDATGQFVTIKSKSASNAIVVRYAIPDRGGDAASWTTVSVYVGGTFRQKLALTSRWSWTYGAFGNANPKDPAQGSPHHFYDEAHALIGDVPADTTVTLQKDADDSAGYYVIDLIDLEQVGPPLPPPANSLSATDPFCGAKGDGASDDSAALQKCIDGARARGSELYIPPGVFRSVAKPLSVDNLTIRGAGMWYSTISGYNAHFDCYGNACKYYDLAVFGDTILRNDASPESTFSGLTGVGTILENIWAEHSKVGYWVGPAASGLVIRHSRFRNFYADGVNLWKGTSDSLVEQSHFRNTGDDSMAAWSQNTGSPDTNNVLRFNTVQIPWMANCIGIYGGTATRIEDNVCEDVVQYPGILIANQFGSQPFQGTTQIVRNSLIRAGGFAYNDGQGALKFFAAEGPMSGFLVQDLFVQDSTYSGIQIQGKYRLDNLQLNNVTIDAPGTSGIRMNFDANGVGVAGGVVVSKGGMQDQSNGAFSWTRGAGNSGW